jgi:tetratricopeptide (TPR) repeat protein
LKLLRFTLRFVLILNILLVSGCASLLNKSGTTSDQAKSAPQNQEDEIKYTDFSIEQDTLYDLLVAEIASQRDQFDITLVNYIHQAQMTRDPAVILRAINAAQIAKDSEAIKELTLIWLEQEPDNISAHQILAYQYSVDRAFPEAMDQIAKILELGGNTSVEALAISSSQASEDEKQELLELYTQLLEKFPESWEVRYSLALVHRNLKQCDIAIEHLEQVIKAQPDFQQAYIVKANCLNEVGNQEEALAYAEQSFNEFPENNALGRLYASLLIEKGDTQAAEDVFATLLDYYPDSGNLALSHALLMLENKKVEEAKSAFETLTASPTLSSDAYYYLGRIAEQQDELEQAIKHYQNVTPSSHYNTAIERYVYLLSKQERMDEALEQLALLRQDQPRNAQKLWLIQYQLLNTFDKKDMALNGLNEALIQFPEDESLLYARAMHYDGTGDIELMEQDLQKIINMNPRNAVALNALGYTLADKTDRLEEALKLITVALALRPDNPAILDSMGWVMFKLGKNEEALALLSKAYINYPDGEVGAHLGEVLWAEGKKEEAKKVWNNSLRQQPNHPILRSTLERLAPEMLEGLDEASTQNNEATEPDPAASDQETSQAEE